MEVGPSRYWFMFISVVLHELAHSALVWYGLGACDSPQLGGIEREGGNYIEKGDSLRRIRVGANASHGNWYSKRKSIFRHW